MLDPIGGFDRIRDFFISYVETSFKISDPETAAERRRLLLTANVLATEPFIEPVLRYRQHAVDLERLIGSEALKPLGDDAQAAFVELALSGLFDGDPSSGPIKRRSRYAPYEHQVKMLERGIRPGRPAIVTSGTGSGKTESFMLPILASLSGEAVRWQKPDGGYLSNFWWREGRRFNDRRHQRTGERRKAAVRALVLYPMNALVADQMVRLRKALDSEEARAVMDDRFGGNRIFFGNYTGETSVTGHLNHPRRADDEVEKERRARRITELRRAMSAADRDQDAARAHDEVARLEAERLHRRPPEQTRFIFPSMDGGEMISRWDMQAAPPDILVTNPSMLGAMLSREVEDAIFDRTREWLATEVGSYFYLIFDELHLTRGSAGTEVSFLVKSLLARLGLDQPAHRHKLRILASSASMSMDGDEGDRSRRYLRDMFAPFGTFERVGDPGSTEEGFWTGCVIPGKPELPPSVPQLPPEPFVDLLRAACGTAGPDGLVQRVAEANVIEPAVRALGTVFGLPEGDFQALASGVSAKAASALAAACRKGGGVRATALSALSVRAFGTDSRDAIRGLMLARALTDAGLPEIKVRPETPSFRVHTFIRNIEGLFGAPLGDRGSRVGFTDLTIIKGTSHATTTAGERGPRLFEMLYCEACGDLFLGGQRGKGHAGGGDFELLPSSPDLESAPDRGAPDLYDKMSFDDYAVFWPSTASVSLAEHDYDQWEEAALDTVTGVISTTVLGVRTGVVKGRVYFQTDRAASKSGRKTAQPFCCPRCGTDYSTRPASNASRSPIRAFRTGFTKASQLVATELFEFLHAIGAEAKSIIFSDSRQDAAQQALEIERLHLRDLRREIFVTSADHMLASYRARQVTPEEKSKILLDLSVKGDMDEIQRLATAWTKAEDTSAADVPARKVRIDRLLQFRDDPGDSVASYVTAEFVRLGIHPFDEVGRATFLGRPWYDAFSKSGAEVRFATHLPAVERTRLGVKILESQQELVDDVIFSNTFFALEETGLAYPSLLPGVGHDQDVLDAWLRVFAGAYRVAENKFFDPQNVQEWTTLPKSQRNRARRFAVAVFGADGAQAGFEDILSRLRSEGHSNGIINLGKLYVRLSAPTDPFWRCPNCERVHLHRGVGMCTRCFKPLPQRPTGLVPELWRSNFLGRRIERGRQDLVGRFGLKCEELTGQTDDFGDRLRRFKDIIVGPGGKAPSVLEREASRIDLMSVTTTMEVGIDIGGLQTVLQANMPPQRFNYQQRVGRAGRRGQAFSFVSTFCRGRSHDEFYFRHPEAITGDPPPSPFLAVDHDPIPQRLLKKVWLRAAFARLRQACAAGGEVYPGDDLVPPDIHGEYIPTDDFYDEGSVWPDRLRDALGATRTVAVSFVEASVLSQAQRRRLLADATPDNVVGEMLQLAPSRPAGRSGIAQFLAERGLLPMYGMPTRVRQLYTGLVPEDPESTSQDQDFRWSTMDRDVEVAVFEYAPGAILTKDKLKHRVVGFTGQLPDPKRRGRKIDVAGPLNDWLTEDGFVAKCPSCGSALYSNTPPDAPEDCTDCHSEVAPDRFSRYLTPSAFRTDFRPEAGAVDDVGLMSTRTIATVLKQGDSTDVGPLRVWSGAGVTVMHLNDGAQRDGVLERFKVEEATDTWVLNNFRSVRATRLDCQAVNLDLCPSNEPTRWLRNPDTDVQFGLMARKETDALYLELRDFDSRLNLDLVAKEGLMRSTSARAAAISATHLLVQRAALDLDVAPDEFEALEPRWRSGRPVIQIADSLINGSGLSRRLSEPDTDGRPEVVSTMERILAADQDWPLNMFLASAHRNSCHTACYRCLQQYGNRRVHNLLDWRLALGYLRGMIESGYASGLDGVFDRYPELNGWLARSHALAAGVAAMRPGSLSVETVGELGLAAVVERQGMTESRMIVIHPLWRVDAEISVRLMGSSARPTDRFVDTFDLERRPLKALELAKSRPPCPDWEVA